MKTKIRTTLMAVFIFFGLLTGLQAQDKYDYAMITYLLNDKILEIDINGVEYKRIDVINEGKRYYMPSPALKLVKTMTNEGWELFDTGSIGLVHVFYLKKKVS